MTAVEASEAHKFPPPLACAPTIDVDPLARRGGGLADSLARIDAAVRRHTPADGSPTTSPRPHLRHLLPDSMSSPWWTCSDMLTQPGAIDRWLAMLADWLRTRYGEAPDQTVAGYLTSWYLAVPSTVGALLFHAERRVPPLRPANLAFRLAADRPRPAAIAVLTEDFACLPTDPAAGTPQTTVAGDEAELARLLRAGFAAHTARFVAAIDRRTRLGRRALWAAATDALDEALWQAGRCCGQEQAGVADAALVLAAARKPFTSASTLRIAEQRTTSQPASWTRRRESCCFHYVLVAGNGPCDTCPRRSRTDVR